MALDWDNIIITTDEYSYSLDAEQRMIIFSGEKGDKGDPGDPGELVWGNITGTLSNQTDLANALAGKQDTLTFDTVPTENSTNPVTSDGIKTALDGKSDPVTGSASGSLISLTDATDAPVADLKVTIEPVQAGSGDPSPDNVRAITGWDACTVMRTGKNLFNKDSTNRNTSATTVESLPTGIRVISQSATAQSCNTRYVIGKAKNFYGKTITFKLTATKYNENAIPAVFMAVRYNNQNIQTAYLQHISSGGTDSATWTVNYDYGDICITLYSSSGVAIPVGDYTEYTDIQIELGSSATAYEPYRGQTVTIDLGGTRYGGTLDVTSGALTVTWASVDLGTLTWEWNTTRSLWISNNIASVVLKPASNVVTTAIASYYASYSNTYLAETAGLIGMAIHTNGSVRIRNGSDSVAPVGQLVYPLAEPITVQLTPTEVRTLLGLNNIWADTGDITSLTYWKVAGEGIAEAVSNTAANAKYDDTQTRKMITNSIETTTTASKSYSAGNLIILNGQLLRATTGIGIGGTITIGSNAEVITLETLLSELSA